MRKKIILVLVLFLSVGCYESYLDDPFYNVNSETTYAIEVKNNAFVGGPTMAGDLVGCAITAPFLPIYFPLKEKYQDDTDKTNSLNTAYGIVPRFIGKGVAFPFRFIKYAFYDLWFYP